MTNQKRITVLKRVIDKGFDDERKISAISTEQMLKFCRNMSEMADVVELQKAVKAGHLIEYLANKDKEDIGE